MVKRETIGNWDMASWDYKRGGWYIANETLNIKKKRNYLEKRDQYNRMGKEKSYREK